MPGEYRWVIEMTIDGENKKYTSRNTLVVAGDPEAATEDETADKEAEDETAVEAVTWGFLKSRATP
ncbi:MAG: hypothetical protein J4F35_22545 [Candidatus Latescibacteria bacterium]|nr:hypothetical protein [Candidatus Latescibacterota bacterium]